MKQTWNRRPPIFFSKSGNSLKYLCFQFCSLPYLLIRVKKVNFLGLVISIRNTKHTNYKGLFTVKYYGLGKKITRPLLMKELTINCHCRFFSFSVCIKRKLANNFSVFFLLEFCDKRWFCCCLLQVSHFSLGACQEGLFWKHWLVNTLIQMIRAQ